METFKRSDGIQMSKLVASTVVFDIEKERLFGLD
jgi:hypothetical protein